jgi:hypothetical protein
LTASSINAKAISLSQVLNLSMAPNPSLFITFGSM